MAHICNREALLSRARFPHARETVSEALRENKEELWKSAMLFDSTV